MREKSGKKADDGSAADDETLDSSDDDSIDEELGFETPLDSVDPYVTFKHALTGEPCPTYWLYAALLMFQLGMIQHSKPIIPLRTRTRRLLWT